MACWWVNTIEFLTPLTVCSFVKIQERNNQEQVRKWSETTKLTITKSKRRDL